MTEKSEEITERFNEKQYIIRVKHASNEKKQYRFFFICEKCNHRERLSNKTLFDINNHKCIKTQEKITTYSQYSPSPLFSTYSLTLYLSAKVVHKEVSELNSSQQTHSLKVFGLSQLISLPILFLYNNEHNCLGQNLPKK